jgi:hypothetical protein
MPECDVRPGDVLLVDGRASVQFAGRRTLTFRVTAVDGRPTYHGWIWLTGYALDRHGHATSRREIYVRRAGLRPVVPGPRRSATGRLVRRTPHRQARV